MSVSWSISHTFQFLAAVFIIFLYALIMMKVKLFNLSELLPLNYAIKIILVPGLLFQVIASHKLNMDTWRAFCPIAIAQFLSHAVIFLVCFFLKTKNFYRTYLSSLVIFGFQEYSLLIYQYVQHTVGSNYSIVSVYALIAEAFIYRPILNYILYKIQLDKYHRNETINQHDPNKIKSKSNAQKKETKENKNENELEDIQDSTNDSQKAEVDGAGNPDITPEVNEEAHGVQSTEEEDETELEKPVLWKTLLFSWVNSTTIAIICGFIWSGIGIDLIDYLQDFTGDLRNAASGATIFVMGAIVANSLELFKVWSPLIPISIVYRFIIMPLIVGGLCMAFNIEAFMTKISVMAACAPASLVGYSSLDDDEDMKVAKSIFNWSVLLYVPAALCWSAIVVETNLFI